MGQNPFLRVSRIESAADCVRGRPLRSWPTLASSRRSIRARKRARVERRQDPSLDRRLGLRARRCHQKAPRDRGQSLHNLAGSERDRIRENVTSSGA